MITRFASLSGRLLVAAVFLFTMTACGGGGGSGDGFYNPGDGDGTSPLTITTSELPEASAGVDYTALVEAAGGKAPYAWTMIDHGGTGFTINSEGFVTGKAPEKGDYGLTVQVTDRGNKTAKFSTILTVSIGPDSLAIATTGLPNAIDGIQYTALIQAAGGKEPYSWAVVDDGGTGFTINSGGFLTGTAPEAGDYGLTIRVTDSVDTTTKTSLILTVTGDGTPQPLAISTNSLPNAEEKKGYTAILEAVGGQGDYQWTLLSNGGSGLQLRPDGLLSGTAPAKGQYAISVSVQDDTRTVSSILPLIVSADSDPLTINNIDALPPGTAGERYAATLNASGGKTPYVWTLVSSGGSGLTLSAAGVLSGIPKLPGNFGLVFKVSDGTSTAQSAATLTISTSPDPELQLTITTTTLPPASRVLYAAAVQATGGAVPYSFSGGDTGSPGTGFTVDAASGSITGNTNNLLPGNYGYSVTVADSAGDTDTRSYIITVPGGDGPPVRVLTENPLPDATVGLTYAVVMRAVGGTGTYTWNILETIGPAPGPTFVAPGGSASPGVLYWASGDIVPGNYLVTIQVSSGNSTDVVTFNLKAKAALAP